MSKVFLTAAVCAALVAGASGLRAQQNASADMAKQHQNMMQLQQAAIDAANAAVRLGQASPLDRAAVQEQATTAQSDLKQIVDHLQDALQHAKAADKEHIGAVSAHEQEALKHADELVAEAQKDSPEGTAIVTHAQAVVMHAQAANKVMAEAHQDAAQH